MKFDFDLTFDYLCDRANFRYCRFRDVIENNGCPFLQIHIGKKLIPYVLADIPFLVLCIVVTIFFCAFIMFLKTFEVKYKKQRATRAPWYWRLHLLLCGIEVLLWGASVCLTSSDGPGQQFMMLFRGAILNMAEFLLVWIALIDMQIINPGWFVNTLAFASDVVVGFVIFMVRKENPPKMQLVLFGFLFPMLFPAFHFFTMIPVCIYRKIWVGLIYLICCFVLNIGHMLIDWFANDSICAGTKGYLSGSSLSVLVFAFYRVVVQLFYTELKKSERSDGLPIKPRRLSELSSSELRKPLPIEVSDYSYSYTYTESESDQQD